MIRRHKPNDPAQRLSLYAAYRHIRSDYQPPECTEAAACWVRDGPPAIMGNHGGAARCRGCGGAPRPPIVTRRPR